MSQVKPEPHPLDLIGYAQKDAERTLNAQAKIQREERIEQLRLKSWKVEKDTLTGEQVIALYRAIQRGAPNPASALGIGGVWSFSDRRSDRAVQVLKRAGLVEFVGSPKKWRAVDGLPEVSNVR